jgi:alanine racemase
MDMVRVGIMQYGFWPSIETFIHYIRNKRDKEDPLIRVLGWKSEVMALKTIQVGEFVGYGISYLAQKKMRTALIPIGYALGYNRSLSNKGRVIINGQRCGVIGVVNMNMIVADVTDLPKVKIGDEAVIIGQQGELEIKVSAFSSISNELNYEVLTHLAKSIKRTII